MASPSSDVRRIRSNTGTSREAIQHNGVAKRHTPPNKGKAFLDMHAYDACTLCPRLCRARRAQGLHGRCGLDMHPRVARAALHFWEEPIISGERGSGTVFFVGCPLGCVFCQNAEISQLSGAQGNVPDDTDRASCLVPGRKVNAEQLATMFVRLEEQGAHNINLVTPTHFAPHVVAAVATARRRGLGVPIVYNTSGYERPEIIDALADTVDVWLTDFKYSDSELAQRYSTVANYPLTAAHALVRMLSQVQERGGRDIGPDATMRRGLIVRHLLLPGALANAQGVLDTIWEIAGERDVDVSIMNQYTPNDAVRSTDGPLRAPVSDEQYEAALTYADDLGFEHIWWQQGDTVDESFIPSWDLTGVVDV